MKEIRSKLWFLHIFVATAIFNLFHLREAKSQRGDCMIRGVGRCNFQRYGGCRSNVLSLSLRTGRYPHVFRGRSRKSRLHSTTNTDKLAADIEAVGEKIRKLKADKVEESEILLHVKELHALKGEFRALMGVSFNLSESNGNKKRIKNSNYDDAQARKKKSSNRIIDNTDAVSSKITPRCEDYSSWYNDVIVASGMAEQSPVRGCVVIKPWGMDIWDLIRSELDSRLKESGASNAYFPMLIPKSFLAKEAEHVDGFAKECAVVTHHRLCASVDGKDLIPDPDAQLEEPLVVRPTSETIIWNMFSKWIHSYRDLPLKINQWANVVRWELRTRPFLRSAEFLWQEGHTAHSSSEDAIETAIHMLNIYKRFCEDMLAMPVYEGRKSPSERFAGADDTYTIEAMMHNGWALQSGTSHYLGQNFAKAFGVYFQAETGKREPVWATSWGMSTRLLGGLVMTHSDDKGLSLPPTVAPFQIVLIPIVAKNDMTSHEVMLKLESVASELRKIQIRVKIDDRENMRPGAKYFEWERKGVPIRIDLGQRDLVNKYAPMTIRHTGEKEFVQISDVDTMALLLKKKLEEIHACMLKAATKRMMLKTFKVDAYSEMKSLIEDSVNDSTKAGFYLAPWKCNAENEDFIKTDCRATIRCYPLELNKEGMTKDLKCFYSGDEATHWALFARAF